MIRLSNEIIYSLAADRVSYQPADYTLIVYIKTFYASKPLSLHLNYIDFLDGLTNYPRKIRNVAIFKLIASLPQETA